MVFTPLKFKRILIRGLLKITIIGQLVFWGSCGKKMDYDVHVAFVDSTFVIDKETYNVGEIIYVLASEYLQAEMSDTTEVLLASGLGDRENIKCVLYLSSPIPEIREHRGQIINRGDSSYAQNNGTLEVRLISDTIYTFYSVHDETAADTAFIIGPIVD